MALIDGKYVDMHTNRMRRARGEIRMSSNSPKKTEYNITQACTRLFQRLGDQATNPHLFTIMNEVAEKDFDLKLDGANPTDLCFIQNVKPDKLADDKVYRRMINSKGKVYYAVVEGPGPSAEEQGEA